MKIIYDDLPEFVEVRLRCEKTRQELRCEYCPFYDRCECGDERLLHTMCCEIERSHNGGENDLQR